MLWLKIRPTTTSWNTRTVVMSRETVGCIGTSELERNVCIASRRNEIPVHGMSTRIEEFTSSKVIHAHTTEGMQTTLLGVVLEVGNNMVVVHNTVSRHEDAPDKQLIGCVSVWD
tara:strand:- start:685 stop:1026 length:342 start_codon:yes stop_codon:yes gene_type:complete